MNKTIFEAIEAMSVGQTISVSCDALQLRQAQMRFPHVNFQPIEGMSGAYVASKHKLNVRKYVMETCERVGVLPVSLDVPGLPVCAVRKYVCEFNAAKATRISVSKRHGSVFLQDDVMERAEISRAQFEELKEELEMMIAMLRAKVNEPMEDSEPITDDFEPADEALPMTIATNCLECGEDILIYQGEPKICDYCRTIE